MIAGYCAPLPPARTGVADYAAALLPALRRLGQVEIEPPTADIFLYHLGNNQIHRDIYARALAVPGVVVLHDAVLHHFFLGSMDAVQYADEFVYNYGEWNRDLARELWRGRASSALDGRYFAFPMLKRIAQASRAVVVHNAAAAHMVRQHAPETPVVEIPHLFQQPELPPGYEVIRFRKKYGFSSQTFVFGVFGYLRESKRLMTILRAFAAVHRARPDTALLVSGSFVSSDLERAAKPLMNKDGVVRLDYLSPSEFWLAASAIDACINLRYPAAGETSGISIRMMGIGKPVMVTDAAEVSGYPETACFRITAGLAEQSHLTENGIVAADFPGTAREVGRRGAGHILLHHSLERIAEQYWETLCSYCSRSS